MGIVCDSVPLIAPYCTMMLPMFLWPSFFVAVVICGRCCCGHRWPSCG